MTSSDPFGHSLLGQVERYTCAQAYIAPASYHPALISVAQLREVGVNVAANGTLSFDFVGMGTAFVTDCTDT